MIDRRRLINGFAFSALGAPLTAARAHAPDKVWRIGYIGIASAGTSPQSDRLLEVFVQALRESGFVEGKNLILERRATEGRTDRSPALVAELIGLPVDVLVLLDIPGVLRAAKETATIPIVMLNASDPVASGLVTSLARPGGNITGLTDFNEDLYPKRLELLKAVAPRTIRVAFVQGDYSSYFDATTSDGLKQKQDAAARAFGISLLRMPMNSVQDLKRVTTTILREGADALLLGAGQAIYLARKEIADFAIRQRLPSIATQRITGTGGALMSYGPDIADNYRKAATYVAKILNGAKPADLPIEQPTKVELVINLKTAKAIGLTLPQSLLLRADEVIE